MPPFGAGIEVNRRRALVKAIISDRKLELPASKILIGNPADLIITRKVTAINTLRPASARQEKEFSLGRSQLEQFAGSGSLTYGMPVQTFGIAGGDAGPDSEEDRGNNGAVGIEGDHPPVQHWSD